MWIVCITSVRHVLTVNGYGGRQTKENEKSWCFKGWETLVITYEFPEELSIGKEPYYPINDEKNTTIFRKYQTLAETNKKVLLGGRLAQYTYADMDDTVEAALSLWNKELQNSSQTKLI